MASVASARYGKDNVRVYKVERDEKTGVQTVTEMTVCVLLEGAIETSYDTPHLTQTLLTILSYTKGDNSVVVATDSMKNTVYIKAKEHPVTPPELFASILGTHFVETYPHITTANIKIVTHRWTRMTIDGKPHPHSFYRDGAETRNVEAVIRKGKGIDIRSGIVGLLVLKSTGSQFHGFVRDEYTTLPEVWDRILSTDVDCGWSWKTFSGLMAVKAAIPKFDKAWSDARTITMKTFAEEDSPSVQNTMYKMCGSILDAVPEVENVDYSLPNKHYFEIGMFLALCYTKSHC
jgi:urate oxidase